MDLECPYCEAPLKVNHDDGANYDQDTKHQMECDNCGKHFVFQTVILFQYYPEKADCLNGGKHEWEQTRTFPVQFTEMECKYCGERRKPTKKEKQSIPQFKL